MAQDDTVTKRKQRRIWLVALLAAVCFCGPVSCLDFGVENETFICRGQHECADGYKCLRGSEGHCICMDDKDGQAKPSPFFSDPSSDPYCENVAVR